MKLLFKQRRPHTYYFICWESALLITLANVSSYLMSVASPARAVDSGSVASKTALLYMIRNAHPALSLRFWSHCCRWRSGDGWWATERLWKRQHCSHHTTDAVSRCSHANTCVLFMSSEAIIQAKTPTHILFYMLGVCASDHTSKRVIVSHECCEPCTRCGQRKRGKQNSSSVHDT